MSDLGLLITGTLETKQEPSPNLSDKSSIHQGKGIEDSIKSKSWGILASLPITPPEFITIDREMDRKAIGNSVRINFEFQNILSEFTEKEEINSISQPKILALVKQGSNSQFRTPSLPTLEFGNAGISVRVLQRLLVSNGYRLRVDGIFGAFTETGVKAFQSGRNLTVDGIVGEKTWKELTKQMS